MSLNVDEVGKLKIGDVIFECQYGMNSKVTLTTEPVIDDSGYQGRRMVKFKGYSSMNKQEIEFGMTEGLEHYGPRLYEQAQYVSIKDGVGSYKIEGED